MSRARRDVVEDDGNLVGMRGRRSAGGRLLQRRRKRLALRLQSFQRGGIVGAASIVAATPATERSMRICPCGFGSSVHRQAVLRDLGCESIHSRRHGHQVGQRRQHSLFGRRSLGGRLHAQRARLVQRLAVDGFAQAV